MARSAYVDFGYQPELIARARRAVRLHGIAPKETNGPTTPAEPHRWQTIPDNTHLTLL